MAEGGLLLLDEPGEPLGAYLRSALAARGLLGDGADGLVLPRLTGETVCQVYAGLCPQPPAQQVLAALLEGRTVWCPWEGMELLGRGALYRLVRERLWTLRRSGLRLCPLGQLAALAGGEDRRRRGYGTGPGPGVGVVHQKVRGAGGV